MLEVTPRVSRGRDKFFSTSSNIRLKSFSIRLRFDAKEEELAMAAYNRRAEGLRPPTGAEVTVKTIQYWGRFEVKKLYPLDSDYHAEKRVISNNNVGDRICPGEAERELNLMASRNFVNLIKVFFLSALALGLGLPHQSTLAAPIMVGLGGKIALAFRRRQKRSSKDSSRRAST
jgi:hypothetical protein